MNDIRKVCTLMLVIMSVFSFSESASANAGMSGDSAFSKWMKVSKGNGEKASMGMTRTKKMKRMVPMKTSMRKMGKSMSDILGEMEDMGSTDLMESSDSMSTNKMRKNKKMGTVFMNKTGSMDNDKKMVPKMKKKMRKNMGKNMYADSEMDKKKKSMVNGAEDEMPKEEEEKPDEGM